MRFNKIAAAFAAMSIGFFAQAQNEPRGVAIAEKGPGYVATAGAVQLQGKVKTIDKKARSVLVVSPQGQEIRASAGPEVKNFDQIAAGDIVTLTLSQALAIQLKPLDNNGIRERVDLERETTAKQGEKPGVVTERAVRVVANVVAINFSAQTITLRGVRKTLDLYVTDPALIASVKVGDQVEAVYSEAVVMAVSAAPKR